MAVIAERAVVNPSERLTTAAGEIEYALRLSPRRRTLCLQVFADGRVRVSAPARVGMAAVHAFVANRIGWIRQQQARLRAAPAAPVRVSGSRIRFLDEELVIAAVAGLRAPRRVGDLLEVPADGDIAHALARWYRAQALAHISARVDYFSAKVGREPQRLRIGAQKTRWGSCSPRGTVSLNWRLLLAPSEILDYVVVHELCHLLHANHGARFWREVTLVMPGHERHRHWLRAYGAGLVL